MGQGKRLAPHETFELHELLTFKTIGAAKSSAMAALVQDNDLKELMQEEFNTAHAQIKELRELLQSSDLFS